MFMMYSLGSSGGSPHFYLLYYKRNMSAHIKLIYGAGRYNASSG